MARYIGPVCRLCRREAMKLFLKGERCYTEKCAIEKRNFPPGQHGKTRKAKLAGYGLQLREKQKVTASKDRPRYVQQWGPLSQGTGAPPVRTTSRSLIPIVTR